MKKSKEKHKYIFNKKSKKIHRLPSTERCNVDQVPEIMKERFSNLTIFINNTYAFAYCKYCFK